MHYDINPIEMAAEIRINELHSQTRNRRLARQIGRRRRKALARKAISALHKGLDDIESLLDKSESEPAQATR